MSWRVWSHFFYSLIFSGFEDPIQTALWQYIKEQMLPANEIEEVMKIAEVLERLGEGNPPNFGSNPISNIEFDLDKDITPIEEKMLMEKFNLKNGPICELFESGMGLKTFNNASSINYCVGPWNCKCHI